VLVDNGHGFAGDLPAGDAEGARVASTTSTTSRTSCAAAPPPLPGRSRRAEHPRRRVRDRSRPAGAVIVEINSRCPSIEVDGHIITDAMPLTVRDHLSYASACDPTIGARST
jgi:hypothetical protein